YVAPDEPPAAHHQLLCDALDEVLEGINSRLMVFMPPGSAKSTYGTVRFPAYYLGRMVQNNIICGSYSADLAESFGKKCRNLISTDEHRALFPRSTLSDDTRAKGEWETSQGGSYKACGVDGSITGRRGDLLLIDDPVKGRREADSDTVKKSSWEWFKSDFLSRGRPGAAVVIIQTRWVEDDISGRILPDDWDGESGDFIGFDGQIWKVICIQAQAEDGKNDPLGREPGEYLWPEWFTLDYWEQTKAAQTSGDMRNWGALYQQTPTPEGGTFFKREWFEFYDELPDKLNRYLTHDDAVTEESEGEDPDYTEIGDWGVDADDNIYAVTWYSAQTTSDIWVDSLLDMVKESHPFVVVGESGVIRRAVEPHLLSQMRSRKVFARLEWLPTIGDKFARARNFQALASMGKVRFPRTDWARKVIDQLVKFPGTRYDDKVDTCGLIGRAIHQTWAPRIPKKIVKISITAQPTLNELMKLDKTQKKRVISRI
ncbi:MAG: hypothetical protein E4H01_02960, partial [Lysobacterales bacterium]